MGKWHTASAEELARQEQRSAVRTIRRVLPYLWNAEEPWIKRRVVLALLALLLSKLIAVCVPMIYKAAVDSLAGEGVSPMLLGAVGLTVAYGMGRLMTVGFQQLRDAISPVWASAPAVACARDVRAYPSSFHALSHHAQDRRT